MRINSSIICSISYKIQGFIGESLTPSISKTLFGQKFLNSKLQNSKKFNENLKIPKIEKKSKKKRESNLQVAGRVFAREGFHRFIIFEI